MHVTNNSESASKASFDARPPRDKELDATRREIRSVESSSETMSSGSTPNGRVSFTRTASDRSRGKRTKVRRSRLNVSSISKSFQELDETVASVQQTYTAREDEDMSVGSYSIASHDSRQIQVQTDLIGNMQEMRQSKDHLQTYSPNRDADGKSSASSRTSRSVRSRISRRPRRKRGDSLERDIGLTIIKSASEGLDKAHFVVPTTTGNQDDDSSLHHILKDLDQVSTILGGDFQQRHDSERSANNVVLPVVLPTSFHKEGKMLTPIASQSLEEQAEGSINEINKALSRLELAKSRSREGRTQSELRCTHPESRVSPEAFIPTATTSHGYSPSLFSPEGPFIPRPQGRKTLVEDVEDAFSVAKFSEADFHSMEQVGKSPLGVGPSKVLVFPADDAASSPFEQIDQDDSFANNVWSFDDDTSSHRDMHEEKKEDGIPEDWATFDKNPFDNGDRWSNSLENASIASPSSILDFAKSSGDSDWDLDNRGISTKFSI